MPVDIYLPYPDGVRRIKDKFLIPGSGKPPLRLGYSSSRLGLGAPTQHKFDQTILRSEELANAAGISAAEMRKDIHWHGYNPGFNADASSLSAFQFVINNGFAGMMMNQKIDDWAAAARGEYDAAFKNYLINLSALKIIITIIMMHEPENDGRASEASDWCKAQARFMKMVAEHDDPNITFSTCYIGNPPTDRSIWNPIPALETLMGNRANAQYIIDRSLCGVDPYPTLFSDGSVEYLSQRIANAMTDYKAWGFKKFSLPEMGLCNYIDRGNKEGQTNPARWPDPRKTPTQQAQRLVDEMWTWALANNVEAICYFDVSDPNHVESSTRSAQQLIDLDLSKIIDTPEELLVFSQMIRGIKPALAA